MSFADQDVLCVDCCVMFVFSSGAREFFHGKGFVNLPRHCLQCKAQRELRSGKRLRRTETHVTCTKCGSNTTVPFTPRQNRPVLFRTCFNNREQTSDIAAA
jgi:CxxC-x17-CxxC domain-containing protein